MRIEILDKVGIKVDGKQIVLGDAIAVATDILGGADVYEENYYFCDGALLVLADDHGCVEEIEIRNDEDQNIDLIFREMEIFKQEKNTVLDYMADCNGDVLIIEDGDYYAKNLGIVFNFEMSEEELEEMIREAKADGVYEEMLDDINHDIYRSKHVGAVLIKRTV